MRLFAKIPTRNVSYQLWSVHPSIFFENHIVYMKNNNFKLLCITIVFWLKKAWPWVWNVTSQLFTWSLPKPKCKSVYVIGRGAPTIHRYFPPHPSRPRSHSLSLSLFLSLSNKTGQHMSVKIQLNQQTRLVNWGSLLYVYAFYGIL